MNEGTVSREEILPLLGETKRQGEWLLAFCPCHADGTKHSGRDGQSLGLSTAGVLRCFAGCEFKDVIAALRARDTRPTPIRSASTPVRSYQYRDANGALLAEKGRFEGEKGKTFAWRRQGEQTWSGGIKAAEMPLYGLPRLLADPESPVYFVEGEKAAESCWQAGLLAVSACGGASQKDFGDALEALRGRDVWLWADNDGPGRAYMTMLYGRLASIARSVRVVIVPIPLPDKGDAFDYFAAGGTVEALVCDQITDAVVRVVEEDTVEVRVPSVNGPVTLTFSEMEKGRRELDASVEVLVGREEPYRERINLESSTARTQFRRDLETLYDKGIGWTRVINKAFNLAREAYLNQDYGMDMADIVPSDGDVTYLDPLLAANGPTTFFGDGSAGKSYILEYVAIHMGLGLPLWTLGKAMLPVLVIDFEDSKENFQLRMTRLWRGMGYDESLPPFAVYYWDARGIALKDQIDALRRKVVKDGIGYYIVDSAGPACGGKPSDEESAIVMFRALKRLGIPGAIIAHVTKGDGEAATMKPFGSAFWHHQSRRTWYVKRVQEEDSDIVDVGLYCRKVNDGRKPSPIGLRLTFEGKTGPVGLEMTDVNVVPELLESTNAANQIWHWLKRPATIKEIAKALDLKERAVETIFRRDSDRYVIVGATTPKSGRPASLWAKRAIESFPS